MVVSRFTFADGERLIRFGVGVLGEAGALLAERGFERYALLTTKRALASAPAFEDPAGTVLHVPAGSVPDAAAAVRAGVEGRPLVALGGGRVVDVAKAIAGADRLECAAIPTTLAGSPFTPFHRMPSGVEEWRLVRPSLVISDPCLLTSLPAPRLAATAMNALAHAMESLYTPRANPVAEMAALRATELVAGALGRGEGAAGAAGPERAVGPAPAGGESTVTAEMAPVVGERAVAAELALAALLAGYAIGTTGLALHHAICQTIVRTCDTPHAETNAVVLPHSARFMAGRAPRELGAFARALGDPAGDPARAGERVSELAAHTGIACLSELGVTARALTGLAAAVAGHPALQNTPGGVGRGEVEALLRQAL